MSSLSSLKQKLLRINWSPGVKILNFDANGLVSVEKPVGMLAHPNSPKDISRSLIRSAYCFKDEMYTASEKHHNNENVYLLNRLDSATSGVILLSLCPQVAASVKQKFMNHEVNKYYRALVFGRYPAKQIVWNDMLSISRNSQGQLRAFVDEYNGNPTETKVHRIKVLQGYGTALSLLELIPITGKTHQLRVHCAHHQFPIVGDETYGNFSLNQMTKWFPDFENRLYLHAHRVSLVYELKEREYLFDSCSRMSKLFL